MPVHTLDLNDAERDVLERVRVSQGLQTIDQAAEWLIKTRLRQSAKQTTGRGRALYVVHPKARQ
ncbi:hypothetical protein [Polaromonas naphthalenivorans]|uniref:hypothetical protein n=1 Tax=Polaromonas naphthalenivorans TaxID=216465 RepID=UPI00059D78BE|nr:hypothetical protein [Polaromonas naphthalenivorans]